MKNQPSINAWCVFALFVITSFNLQGQTIAPDTLDNKAMPEKKLQPKERKFSITLSGMANQSFRRLKSEDEKPLINCRNEHEKAVYTITPRLEFGIRLGKHCWIDVGAQYQQYGFDMTETVTMNSNPSYYQYFVVCDVNNVVDQNAGYIWNGYFDPRFSILIKNASAGTATLNYRFRYNFLELPVAFRFRGNLGKIALSGRIGIANGYLLKNATSVEFIAPSEGMELIAPAKPTSMAELPNYYNRFNIPAFAGVDCYIPFGDTWQLRAGIEGAYQLQSHILLQPFTEHYYRIGAVVGVVYGFGG